MSCLEQIRSTSRRNSLPSDPKSQDEDNAMFEDKSTSTISSPASLSPMPKPGSLAVSPSKRNAASPPTEPGLACLPPSPAYTANTETNTIPTDSSASDDNYPLLGQFDIIFLIDDSGSMADRGWRETGEALEQVTLVWSKWYAIGIDIWFLNAPQQAHFFNVKSVDQVQRIFREQKPHGVTPIGARLNHILRPYLRNVEINGAASVKPLNIIVITDGGSLDDPKGVIISAANKLKQFDAPSGQVSIQFFQVGNTFDATQDLDDRSVGNNCLRDIVDTVKFNAHGANNGQSDGDKILKVVLGSVDRILDSCNIQGRG